jgi:hypothetical protein
MRRAPISSKIHAGIRWVGARPRDASDHRLRLRAVPCMAPAAGSAGEYAGAARWCVGVVPPQVWACPHACQGTPSMADTSTRRGRSIQQQLGWVCRVRMVWVRQHGRDRRPDRIAQQRPPGIRYRSAIRRFGATRQVVRAYQYSGTTACSFSFCPSRYIRTPSVSDLEIV